MNVGGTEQVLAAARAAGVTRFVHVSSPSVAHLGTSLAGAGAGPADPERARGHYARTKAAAELLALAADEPAACGSSSCGRTSCGDRGTPSWSAGSSSAHARVGCPCSVPAPR